MVRREVVWRAGEDLPWPEVADFSGFDLTNFVFAASGLDEPEARKLPPRAIWRGARLHGAKFFGLALRGQDFSGADASGSFWVDCDFSGVGSEEFDLSAAELRSCAAEAPLAASAITPSAAGSLAGGRSQSGTTVHPHRITKRLTTGMRLLVGPILAIEIDGKPALASGSDDNTIRLWNMRSGETLRVLEGHTGSVASLTAIEIDAKPALASGSWDNTIRLWNPQSGETFRVLEGHTGHVTSLAAIEIDGNAALASGSDDNTIRLWNPQSGETLRVLEGHTSDVISLAAIEIDGKPALASGSR